MTLGLLSISQKEDQVSSQGGDTGILWVQALRNYQCFCERVCFEVEHCDAAIPEAAPEGGCHHLQTVHQSWEFVRREHELLLSVCCTPFPDS